MDIAVNSQTVGGNEDRRWAAVFAKGYDTCRSITLDVSTFLAAHVADKGAIPSGTVLGKITASGKYGPYDDTAVDGRQTAAGFLFNTTEVGYGIKGSDVDLSTAPDVGGALYWEGVITEAYLPTFVGTVLGEIDTNGKADLKFCRFE